MQSRMMSAVEAVVNVIVGYFIAVATTAIILPLFGYIVSGSRAAGIAAVFTLVSLVRSYVLRRAFERMR